MTNLETTKKFKNLKIILIKLKQDLFYSIALRLVDPEFEVSNEEVILENKLKNVINLDPVKEKA